MQVQAGVLILPSSLHCSNGWLARVSGITCREKLRATWGVQRPFDMARIERTDVGDDGMDAITIFCFLDG